MIYLYSTRTKEITKYDNAVILNENDMSNLELVHKEDIRNNFGKIVVNPKTMTPEYVPTKVWIAVNKTTNDFVKVNVKGEDDENTYYAEVLFKDYVDHTSIDVYNKVAKFYNGQFFMFPVDKIKKYNAKDNSWVIDIDRFRSNIIDKISNAEDDIRHHGFYYSLFPDGETYLQPFRNVNRDNDQTTILALLANKIPLARKLKIFSEDPTTGERLTAPKTFKWILNGQVTDTVLDALSILIMAYSESIKAGMNWLIKKTQDTNSIAELEQIDQHYIKMILLAMQRSIEGNVAHKALLDQVRAKIASEHIDLVPDNNFVGGSEFNG